MVQPGHDESHSQPEIEKMKMKGCITDSESQKRCMPTSQTFPLPSIPTCGPTKKMHLCLPRESTGAWRIPRDTTSSPHKRAPERLLISNDPPQSLQHRRSRLHQRTGKMPTPGANQKNKINGNTHLLMPSTRELHNSSRHWPTRAKLLSASAFPGMKESHDHEYQVAQLFSQYAAVQESTVAHVIQPIRYPRKGVSDTKASWKQLKRTQTHAHTPYSRCT